MVAAARGGVNVMFWIEAISTGAFVAIVIGPAGLMPVALSVMPSVVTWSASVLNENAERSPGVHSRSLLHSSSAPVHDAGRPAGGAHTLLFCLSTTSSANVKPQLRFVGRLPPDGTRTIAGPSASKP